MWRFRRGEPLLTRSPGAREHLVAQTVACRAEDLQFRSLINDLGDSLAREVAAQVLRGLRNCPVASELAECEASDPRRGSPVEDLFRPTSQAFGGLALDDVGSRDPRERSGTRRNRDLFKNLIPVPVQETVPRYVILLAEQFLDCSDFVTGLQEHALRQRLPGV